MGVAFELDGRPPAAGDPPPRAEYNPVSGDFLQALGVPLVSGRWLDTRADGASPRPAPVLVNRAFADTFFPGSDPIGHRLTGDGEEWLRIVGVAGDVRQSRLDAGARPAIYPPHGQDPLRRLYVTVRTTGDPSDWVRAVGAAVAAEDPLVPITRFAPMREVVSESLVRTRLFAGLLACLAALALVLGAVGIYGVVSYGVSQRTREIGVRMALGADRRTVLLDVLRGGLRPVVAGLLAGLALAAAGGRLLSGYLYEVTSRDPLTFTVVGAGVLVVAVAAALGPARRAAGLDPIVAVRAE
jgi:predicted permease